MRRRVLLCLVLGTAVWAQDAPTVDGRTLEQWLEVLAGQDPIQHATVVALGGFGEPAVAPLIRLLREAAGGDIRFLAQASLARIGEPAVPELRRIFDDGDTQARIGAVLALETIQGQAAVPFLTEVAQSGVAVVAARAHGALLRLGAGREAHLPPLLAALDSPDEFVRWIAAESLGWCGPVAAGGEAALIRRLDDPAPGVRDQARAALLRIGTREARVAVALRGADQVDAEGLAERLAALLELGRLGPDAAGVADRLRTVRDDRARDMVTRGYAAWALEQVAPEPREPTVYHVAQRHPAADDAGPGTVAHPWRTVQRAAESLRAGDTVIVHAGVYREEVRPFLGGEAERPITYRAAAGEEVVLTGSDVWQPAWSRVTLPGGAEAWQAAYSRHAWDHPESWPEPNQGPMHRAEQLFADGRPLVHVPTAEELAARDDAFATDDEAGVVRLRLAGGAAPDEVLIERSVRQQVFVPAVRGLGHLHLVGLSIRHAANPESNGANWGVIGHRAALSVRSGHHWLIEDCTVRFANAQGIDLGGEGWGSDVTACPRVSDEIGYHLVRRCEASDNGVAGMVGWSGGMVGTTVEDCVTNRNGTKGNFYAYEAAGVKFHTTRDVVVRRHRAHGNQAFGIWFDFNCQNSRISQTVCTDNVAAGIFYEVSPGPMLIDGNIVIGTRQAAQGGWAEGLYSHDGNRATYAHNLVLGCANYGVRLRNLFGRVGYDGLTTTSHNRLVGNVIGMGHGAVCLNPEVELARDNRSDGNVFLDLAEDRAAFELEAGGGIIEWANTPMGANLGLAGSDSQALTLARWRQFTGNDTASTISSAAALGLPLPTGEITADSDFTALRAWLNARWPADAPPLGGRYGELAGR